MTPIKTRFGFPPVPDRPTYPTEPPLSARLADLSAFWLMPQCACSRSSVCLPVRRLAADHGWDVPLSVILERMTCHACGRKPDAVTLTDRPDRMGGGHGGGPEAWTMEMISDKLAVRQETTERRR